MAHRNLTPTLACLLRLTGASGVRQHYVQSKLASKASLICYRSFSGTPRVGAKKPSKKVGKVIEHKPLAYSPATRRPNLQASSASSSSRTKERTARWRKVSLIALGVPVFVVSAYVASLYATWSREGTPKDVPADVSDRYDEIAASFDSSVESVEKSFGIIKLRKKMAAQAAGDVCEVSIGTGRNLSYYDWDFKGYNGVGRLDAKQKMKRGKVKSFTAVDKSQQMLEMAHQKFMTEYPGILGIRWVIQDASEPLPTPPVSANERSGNKTDKKYDTIVQTMGLCSTPNPVALLKNLGESIEADGRILLLEHGKSTWEWVNRLLDSTAPKHADQFGCWWNKDIEQIVKDSGLEVVELKRKHFGTTYWIELKRPKQEGVAQPLVGTVVPNLASSQQPMETSPPATKSADGPKRWW